MVIGDASDTDNDDKSRPNKENHPGKNVVLRGLDAIIDHYCQPIHHIIEEVPPYFDDLLGHPANLPPVVKFWIDQLVEDEEQQFSSTDPCQEDENKNDGNDKNLVEWIILDGYVSKVRPMLIVRNKPSIRGIPVLQHYELLFSSWLEHSSDDSTLRENKSSMIMPPSSSFSSSMTKSHKLALENTLKTIEILASDITLLSAAESPEENSPISKYVLGNILFPTLLRLSNHCLTVLSRICYIQNMLQDEVVKTSLIRLAVSLLPFRKNRLDPPSIAPSLAKPSNNNLLHWKSLCSHPPPLELFQNEGDSIVFRRSLSLEHIDWGSCTLEASTNWSDPITGITPRVTGMVWNHLMTIVGIDEMSPGKNPSAAVDRGNTEKSGDYQKNSLNDMMLLLRLGGDLVRIAQAIRAHFFGRDMLLLEEENIVSTRILLGRTVTTTSPRAGDEKPYRAVPLRIHTSLYFISLLRNHHFSELTTLEETYSILEHLLPVCYALVDSTSPDHTAMGITALICLLDCTTVIPKDSPRTNQDSVWNTYVEGILSVLKLAFIACREGSIFVLIGQAQSRLFRATKSYDRERRQVSREWLSKLHQGVHRQSSASNEVLWELLIGGIIPLLQQQAELPNADAMELGRLGLAALLPLVSAETFVEEPRVKMAALVALINLMMGAYPIIPHHVDKIITSLLVAACTKTNKNSDDDDDKNNNTEAALAMLAKHTAAIAIILCGPLQAVPVLQDVISKRECYEDQLTRAAVDIQKRSIVLQEEASEFRDVD